MKIIAFIILTCVSASAFSSNFFLMSGKPFSGPYAGINVGYRYVTVKDKVNNTIFAPDTFNIQLHATAESMINNITGGINLGYGIASNNLFLGLEGRAIFANNKANSGTLSLTETNSQLMLTSNFNVTLKNEFALLFKFGYISTSSTLFYGLIGPQWGYFQANTNTSYMQNLGTEIMAATQNSGAQYDPGFLVGVGMEHLVTDKVGVAIEFAHVNYSHVNYPLTAMSTIMVDGIPFPNSSLTEAHRFSSQDNSLFLKVNYYFI